MADRDDLREPDDVTGRLNARRSEAGNGRADLPSLVYQQLKQLAHRQLQREHGDPALSTTVLVHEAWLQISDNEMWDDRAHFYGYAATAMRHILVDEARRRLADKRGGGAKHINLEHCEIHVEDAAEGILGLDHALEELARDHASLAEVVELRFFAGLSVVDTAEVLNITPRSVVRNWRMARAMIHLALERDHVS